MATATKRPARLSDQQLAEVLELVKGADTVELKLTVPESSQRSTVAALEIDPLDAQIRQVFFFETPELALNKAGVVVRARRVQGKGNDSVVKLRPVVPADLPEELRKSPNLGVEVDALPGGFVARRRSRRSSRRRRFETRSSAGSHFGSSSPRSSGSSSPPTHPMASSSTNSWSWGRSSCSS